MSALVNCENRVRTDRCIMVVLDDKNYDVFRKVLNVYFHHFLYHHWTLTDLDGVCKKTNVHNLNVSATTWLIIFKIINLAGYYIVHDVNFSDLWIVGTYEDIVVDKKYSNYIQLLNELLFDGEDE